MDERDAWRSRRRRATNQPRCRLRRALGGAAVHRHLPRRRTGGAQARGRTAGTRRGTRRRGRAPTAQLEGSGGHVLGVDLPRRGDGADRSLLRTQGTDAHPRHREAPCVHHSGRVRAHAVSARSLRGHPHRRAGRKGHRRARARGACLRRTARRRADGGHGCDRSRQPGIDRLHLRHDKQPERRRTQPSDAGFRDASTAAELPGRPRSPAHRNPGWSLHRHAGRLPHPGARRRTDRPVRCVGPRQGTQAHRERRAVDRRRAALLCHQLVGPSRLHPGPHESLHDGRPRWLDGPGGRHPAARRSRHVRLPLLWQQRTPVHHRLRADRAGGQAPLHRRQPAARRRDPTRTRRRDLQPRPRSVPGLHRSRTDRQGLR